LNNLSKRLICMNIYERDSQLREKNGGFTPTIGGVTTQLNSSEGHTRLALSQRFSLLALAMISAIASVSVWLLSWFITERMLWQEGVLTRDFVHSLMLAEKPMQNYMRVHNGPPPPEVEASFKHIALMPDMVRANVYDLDRKVIWSSERELIGRFFGANNELDLALTGAVVVEKKSANDPIHGKAEHEALRPKEELFIEIYLPVLDVETSKVIGAIEFYKNPHALSRVLTQLRNYIVMGALVFGLLLFFALFWLVRRADRTMQHQERQLVEQETFAVVGEMSSVVAHGIRNPLASIRSSAELILQLPDNAVADAAKDIVAQSDRLSSWLHQLLAYTKPADTVQQSVALTPLVRTCLQEHAHECERRRIETSAHLPNDLPAIRGDSLAIDQVLRTLLGNAMEALPRGGRITVRAIPNTAQGNVTLTVQDNGSGMTQAQRERVGKPFFTTKPHGMGVGLALARRVIERAGGNLGIESELGSGTMVSLLLLIAPPENSKP
jgi:two-component system, NtrC family, sensor histidine kinase HydH